MATENIEMSRPENSCFFRSMAAALVLGILAAPRGVWAADAPHTNSFDCTVCHMTHGGSFPSSFPTLLTNAAVNLCLSCHTAGGLASGKPFAAADQALPWPGLPAGTNATGSSHRWDSGAAGHAVFLGGAGTPSTGTMVPAGVYTGYYPKTYTLIVSNAGSVGTATFNWNATAPGGGGGTNVLTAASVSLDQGISVSFANGTGVSFQANDRWNILVRPDLRQPTNTDMSVRLVNGIADCTVCHDEHKQRMTPFDPAAPTNTTAAGRHFMRVNNDQHQMCVDCHAARNVTNSVFGSHPVGIVVATNAYYKTPTNLPVEKATGRMGCLTCHDTHYVPGNNGMLLRLTNTVALCADCHRLADTNTPAAHLVGTNANMLWPGGQYGSLLTNRTDVALRGSCLNCHMVHGWPDAASPTNHYPTLLADREENLCFTCHDSDGPAAKRVKADFDLAYHHPVVNSDPYRRAGRTVECSDCHHTHDALANGHVYTNAATSARNLVSNPLKGVSGVAMGTNGLANFQVITSARYSVLSETNGGATCEYQVCYKCHSGYGYPAYTNGTASFTNGSATVNGSGTSWTTNMIGMWIANTNDTRSYAIIAVVSATQLTISPAYADASVSGQGFFIRSVPAGLTPYYNTGTALFTPGSTNVTGTGTSWNSGMIGSSIYGSNNPTAAYIIINVVNATNLTIYPAYGQ